MHQAYFKMGTLTLEGDYDPCDLFPLTYSLIQQTFLLPLYTPGSLLSTGDTTVKGTSLSPQAAHRLLQYRGIRHNAMTYECCLDRGYCAHFTQLDTQGGFSDWFQVTEWLSEK